MNTFITTFLPNVSEIWDEVLLSTWETLYMTLVAGLIAGILGVILGVILVVTEDGGILESRHLYNVLDKLVNIFRSLPFIILMALIVWVTWEDRGYLCRCLDTRYLHTIGVLSFSIYMWHYLIKFIAKQDWEGLTGLPVQSSVMGSVLLVVCMIGLLIPIAVWSYRYLEMPTRKWISLRLNGLLEAKYSPSWQLVWVSSERKR